MANSLHKSSLITRPRMMALCNQIRILKAATTRRFTAVVLFLGLSLQAAEQATDSQSAAPSMGNAPTQRFVTITAEFEQFEFPSGDIKHPANLTNLAFSAVCTTGTNEWRIDLSFGQGEKQELCFDGTNVYYNNIFPSGNSRVTISSRPSYIGCPLGMTMHNMPWLAFCSGNYLKRERRLIPMPVPKMVFVKTSPDSLAYSDRTLAFPDDLGLPQTVDMFASDSLFSASVTNGVFQGTPDVELWKRGSTGFKWDFPDGALGFHYAATMSTNFLGWNIPVAFEWFRNDFEHGALVPRMGGKGRVTSIIASRKPASVIEPGVTILDYRFHDAGLLSIYDGAIEYTATNSYAAPTNDPVLQKKLAERLARVKRGP